MIARVDLLRGLLYVKTERFVGGAGIFAFPRCKISAHRKQARLTSETNVKNFGTSETNVKFRHIGNNRVLHRKQTQKFWHIGKERKKNREKKKANYIGNQRKISAHRKQPRSTSERNVFRGRNGRGLSIPCMPCRVPPCMIPLCTIPPILIRELN